MADSSPDKGDRRVAEATGDFYCEAEQVRGSLKCQRPCDSCWKAFAPSASEATGETPRTDALLVAHISEHKSVTAGLHHQQLLEHARQLERELARMNQVYANACSKVVRMGVTSFGTLDEGLDKLAAIRSAIGAHLNAKERKALRFAANMVLAGESDDVNRAALESAVEKIS